MVWACLAVSRKAAPERPVIVMTAYGAIDTAVEDLLALALDRASAAGEWAVVAQLARELEARRGAAGSSK
jgi:DNA-binding NtrC family response regulator